MNDNRCARHRLFFYAVKNSDRIMGIVLYYSPIKRFNIICEADLRQTRRKTQADLTPGKDDINVWHNANRKDIEWFYLRRV